MLNKLTALIHQYEMLRPGDAVVCAVSGGADSMALLWAMYLLKEKLGIKLSAAHFNHGLRGEESDRDEAFVRDFCQGFDIPFFCGRGMVAPGKKGLEAAARDARYAFLNGLPGKIATAHTADDNAETVLMHLVRGTGLKGLGGVTPVNGKLIRPMLSVTRDEVCAFLEAYSIGYLTDSSNDTDAFLRNRLRHHVMPLLREENPRLGENLSAMALSLREDEAQLAELAEAGEPYTVTQLRQMGCAQRSRALERLLLRSGVPEPERQHIALAEKLVFSQKPSARADFPGGVTLGRDYDRLERVVQDEVLECVKLSCPGRVELPQLGLWAVCEPAAAPENTPDSFTVAASGTIVIRSRQPGDSIRLSGGRKTLKKLFIDRKIPAAKRENIPVAADDIGVLGVLGIGADLDRVAEQGVRIRFEKEIE